MIINILVYVMKNYSGRPEFITNNPYQVVVGFITNEK
jgi:hypothetical protein